MIKPVAIPIAFDAGPWAARSILVYRSPASLFSRLADFLHNWPGVALAIMMTFGLRSASLSRCDRRAVGDDGAERDEGMPRDSDRVGCVVADHSETITEYARRSRFTLRDSRCTTMAMADVTMALVVRRRLYHLEQRKDQC